MNVTSKDSVLYIQNIKNKLEERQFDFSRIKYTDILLNNSRYLKLKTII